MTQLEESSVVSAHADSRSSLLSRTLSPRGKEIEIHLKEQQVVLIHSSSTPPVLFAVFSLSNLE